ncbi:hypothetical protein CXG81DRAFT_14893, partial [Caulochytrium protostelioides]
DDDDDDDDQALKDSVRSQNRKHKKSGGFQSMGLSYPVFNAIMKKGYKIPTPIQRKAIPQILDQRDVIAMARTGSGKTAAFLIPVLERLKTHSAQMGARAIILSPSRELALQTSKFALALGRFTDLKIATLVGGEALDQHFASIAQNPDIIIATPGRFMHIMLEMSLSLDRVQMVVFDEADRLFEMGFADQLREILFKMPPVRQTILFSATLPTALAEFARAGLQQPVLIRLDGHARLSHDLQLMFLYMHQESKEAALLYMLNHVIPKNEQTILFAATKHHVEYLHALVRATGMNCAHIHGGLDQTARNSHLGAFRKKYVNLLIVTDVAARGIDIPFLDHVINYDFPASTKLFVHRVGRVARAGRTGTAWSFITSPELPFALNLQMFSERPLLMARTFHRPDYNTQFVIGTFPIGLLTADQEHLAALRQRHLELVDMQRVSENGYKVYARSRGRAPDEFYDHAKTHLQAGDFGMHPLARTGSMMEQTSMVTAIGRFRPPATVFETASGINKVGNQDELMAKRRAKFGGMMVWHHEQQHTTRRTLDDAQQRLLNQLQTKDDASAALASSLAAAAAPSSLSSSSTKRKRDATDFRDGQHFMAYRPSDDVQEKAFAITAEADEFVKQSQREAMEFTGEAGERLDRVAIDKAKAPLVWDKKKHNFVRHTIGADNQKRFTSESGASLPASLKADRYSRWARKTGVALPGAGETELDHATTSHLDRPKTRYRHNNVYEADPNSKNAKRKAAQRERLERKGLAGAPRTRHPEQTGVGRVVTREEQTRPKLRVVQEIKSKEQILRARRDKEKRREKTGRHTKPTTKRRR